MNLPTVFETCEPREDVLTGTIAEANFAADLAKVIRGTASDDYQIPARFFANTYPTAGLKNLLRNVLLQVAPDYMKPVNYDTRKLLRLLGPQRMTSYADGIGQTLTWISSSR